MLTWACAADSLPPAAAPCAMALAAAPVLPWLTVCAYAWAIACAVVGPPVLTALPKVSDSGARLSPVKAVLRALARVLAVAGRSAGRAGRGMRVRRSASDDREINYSCHASLPSDGGV